MNARVALGWLLLAASLAVAGLPLYFLAEGGPETPPTPAICASWAALLIASAVAAVAHRASQPPLSIAAALTLAALGAIGLASLSAAVAAECQNYWPAIGFAAQFWAGALAVLASFVSLVRQARAGTRGAGGLAWAAGILVGGYLLLWAWMTLASVRDLEGAVLRWLFLQTHG